MSNVSKRIESASKQAVSYRNYRRARDRALTRLAQEYPEYYKELLEEEKARDEKTGAKWDTISGPRGSRTYHKSAPRSKARVGKRAARKGYHRRKA